MQPPYPQHGNPGRRWRLSVYIHLTQVLFLRRGAGKKYKSHPAPTEYQLPQADHVWNKILSHPLLQTRDLGKLAPAAASRQTYEASGLLRKVPCSKLSPALRMSKPRSSEPPISSEAEVLARQWHVAGWGWAE